MILGNPGVPHVVERKDGEIVDSVSEKIGGRRVIIAFHHASWDAPNTWTVALVVGATRRQKKAMRMRGDLKDTRRTKAGLVEALRWAAEQLDKFQKDRPGAVLVVMPSDEARNRAYAWLLRKGFQRGQYDGESVYFRTS